MAEVVQSDRRVATCRWGTLTLFQPYPQWLASDECPWTCARGLEPRPLETTVECVTCAEWAPRPAEGSPIRGVRFR